MKRRLLSLFLLFCLLLSLLPAAMAQEESPSVTALCVALPDQSVSLDVEELRILCRQATGHELERVSFPSPYSRAGTLSCHGERVTPQDTYYLSTFTPRLSQVTFTPTPRFTGQGEVSFLLVSEKEETVPGTLLLHVPQGHDLVLPLTPDGSLDGEALDKLCRQKTGYPLGQLSFLSIQGVTLRWGEGEDGILVTSSHLFSPQPTDPEELSLSGVRIASFHSARALFTLKLRSTEGKAFTATAEIDLPDSEATRWAREADPSQATHVGDLLPRDQREGLTFTLPSSAEGALWLDYGSSNARKLLPEEVLSYAQDPSYLLLDFVPTPGTEASLVHLAYTISSGPQRGEEQLLSLRLKQEETPQPVSTSLPVSLRSPRTSLSATLAGACGYRGLGQAGTVTFSSLPYPEEGILQSDGQPVEPRVPYPYRSLSFLPGEEFSEKLTLPYTGKDSLGFSYSGLLTLVPDPLGPVAPPEPAELTPALSPVLLLPVSLLVFSLTLPAFS